MFGRSGRRFCRCARILPVFTSPRIAVHSITTSVLPVRGAYAPVRLEGRRQADFSRAHSPGHGSGKHFGRIARPTAGGKLRIRSCARKYARSGDHGLFGRRFHRMMRPKCPPPASPSNGNKSAVVAFGTLNLIPATFREHLPPQPADPSQVLMLAIGLVWRGLDYAGGVENAVRCRSSPTQGRARNFSRIRHLASRRRRSARAACSNGSRRDRLKRPDDLSPQGPGGLRPSPGQRRG